MRITDLMSQPAVTCLASDTLAQAADLMWKNDCGVIPVVDNQQHAIGMITDRDCCMVAYKQGKALHEIPIESGMSRDVLTCTADDSIEDIHRRMSDAKVRRLPVVDDDGKVIGVVSLNDLARFEQTGGATHQVASTFAQVGQPPGNTARH